MQVTENAISHPATGWSQIKKPTYPTSRWASNTSAYFLMSLPTSRAALHLIFRKLQIASYQLQPGKNTSLAKHLDLPLWESSFRYNSSKGQMQLETNDSWRKMASAESRNLRTTLSVVTHYGLANHSTTSLRCSSLLLQRNTFEWRHSSRSSQYSTSAPCHSSRV